MDWKCNQEMKTRKAYSTWRNLLENAPLGKTREMGE
jgi:hypothetical protein